MPETTYRVWLPEGVGLGLTAKGVDLKFEASGEKVIVFQTSMQDRTHVLASFADPGKQNDFEKVSKCSYFRLRRCAVLSEHNFWTVMAVVQAMKSATHRHCGVRVRVNRKHNVLAGCVGVINGWNFDRRRVNVIIQDVCYPLDLRWLSVCGSPEPQPEGGGDL